MRDALFQQFATVIHQQFGIQLPMDKKALLESRLFKLLNNNVGKPEYANEEAFLRYVQNDVTGKALAQLSEVITTHHTFFMREQDHFQFFGDTVLPELENYIKDGDVRTWCAACSSGEESYTLAMQLHDFFGIRGPGWEYTLLATDLSREILETAKQGIYSAESVATYVSPFLGRLDDISQAGIDLIRDIAEIFRIYGYETEIIAASIRNPIHVTDCALAGADIATIPYNVIEAMTKHPLTDQGIAKFQKDYIAVFGE